MQRAGGRAEYAKYTRQNMYVWFSSGYAWFFFLRPMFPEVDFVHARRTKPSTPKMFSKPFFHLIAYASQISLPHLSLFFSLPCNFDKVEWFMRSCLKAKLNLKLLVSSTHAICNGSAMSSQNSILCFSAKLCLSRPQSCLCAICGYKII